MRRLQDEIADRDTKTEKEFDSNVTSASDSFSDGEVQPSEDEMLNVKYSESETSVREPLPGPSGTQKSGPPRAPMKRKSEETKGKGTYISPIKYPKDTPVKNKEDVPLSKLIPRYIKPPCVRDLRNRLEGAPGSPERRLADDMGPMRSRIGCEFPPRQSEGEWRPQDVWSPFLPGQTPINNPWLHATNGHMRCSTAHHSRRFIEGQSTSKDEGTMTDEGPATAVRENEESDVTQDDVTQEEEAEFNDRGEDKDKQH